VMAYKLARGQATQFKIVNSARPLSFLGYSIRTLLAKFLAIPIRAGIVMTSQTGQDGTR
jgi:hypothetical protein